jgi:integrase
MRDLLSAVDAMGETSQSPIRHLVMPELLRVLYGCGLRCGEAVRLTVGDVDLNEGVLTIREGKFLRDRLTPVAPALLRRLRVYASAICGRTPDSSFFPGPHGGAYSVQTVYAVFRRLLRIVGISHGGRGVGPRLHDIRATFAVHRVEAWYREGADLGVKLPILSAYMGHRSLTGTQRYLRLTMAIFPELTRHFEQAYGHLVPILPEP